MAEFVNIKADGLAPLQDGDPRMVSFNVEFAEVYDTEEPIRMGAHVYAHSRKDGQDGVAYLVINNSLTEATTAELPKEAQRYTLAGKDGEIRATVMTLNGEPLVLGEDNSLPEMEPETVPAGEITFEPGTITFLAL